MRHACFIIPALIFLVHAATAPALAQESADAFADRFVSASLTGDGEALADLVHPEALEMLASGLRALVAEPAAAARVYERLGIADRSAFDRLNARQMYAKLIAVAVTSEAYQEFRRTAKVTLNGHTEEPRQGMVAIRYTVEGNVNGEPLSSEGVLTLKRDGDEWRAWPAGEIELVLRTLGGTT